MESRISDNDITNYVMNELEPRERLYVESMMLGCDRAREDAMSLMEVSRLLEEGLEGELLSPKLMLDEQRRNEIFAHSPTHVWESMWRISAAAVAMAACVAATTAGCA
jgi:anti-sigma factor RsiW